MKLYEYQAKALYERFQIPKPQGQVVFNTRAIPQALKKLGRGPWVLKAQIQAGGRGKAGGIKMAKNAKEARLIAIDLFKKPLVTHQTGPQGEKVVALLIEKPLPKILRELYMGLALDRKKSCPLLLVSKEGGIDIETLAKEKPDSILHYPLDPQIRLPLYQARLIAKDLGLKGKSLNEGAMILSRLGDAFFSVDANLIEINPLAQSEDGSLMALDGKITTDDNALYRHNDQKEWKEASPQPAAEKRAYKGNISYLQLEGNVGCLVNGAGLAMATMDIIKLYGGEPANFLDVGGGANTKQVTEAFRIILSDKRVKGILVNIFGGIMRCDVIAEGIVAAVKEAKLKVPLVVRLQGNKSQEGKEILSRSNLLLIAANGLAEAAQLIVEVVNKNGNKK